MTLRARRYWGVARLVLWRGWRPVLLTLGWAQPVVFVWLLVGGMILPTDAWLNRFLERTPWPGTLPFGFATFLAPFVWAVVWFVLATMPRRLAPSLPIAAVRQDWVLQCGRCGHPIDFDRELVASCPACGAANLDPVQLPTDVLELPRSQAVAAIDQIQGVMVGIAFAAGVMVLGICIAFIWPGADDW